MLQGTEVHAMQHALHYGDGGETAFLLHSDLPQQIQFNSNDLHIDFHVDELFGVLQQVSYHTDSIPLGYSIENAINEGLAISHHMLLTIGANTFALIFEDGVFYIVDSHSRNAQGMACSEGVAVVLSFSCISDLLTYLHKMYDNLLFNLTPISVRFQQSQTLTLSGQEFHAPTTASNKKFHASAKVLQGNSHQGSPQFGMKAGTQCTAVAFTFLMYSVFISIEHWTPDDLTEAIHRGTLLHTRQQQLLYSELEHVYLQHNDLPTNVNIFTLNLQVELYADMFYGVISQDPLTYIPCASNIESAIEVGITLSDHMILTMGTTTVAIIHDEGLFFLADSHSRDANGMPCPEGTAVVLTFTCISDLLAYLRNLYSTMPFNLTPVSFQIENDYPMRAVPVHSKSGLQLNNEHVYFPGNCDFPNNCGEDIFLTDPIDDRKKMSSINNNHTYSSAIDTDIHMTAAVECRDNDILSCNHIHFSNLADFLCTGAEADTDMDFFLIEKQSENFPKDNCAVTACDVLEKQTTDVTIDDNYVETEFTSFDAIADDFVKSATDVIINDNDVEMEITSSIGAPHLSNDDTVYTDNFDNHNDDSHTIFQAPDEYEDMLLSDLSDASVDPTVNALFVKQITQYYTEACEVCRKILLPAQIRHCNVENEAVSTLCINRESVVCQDCCSKLCKRNIIPAKAFIYNKLNPGAIPAVLKALWVIEKRLISLIQIFLTMVLLPGGQHAQIGTAINFPIDIQNQTNSLFSLIPNHANIVTVSCERPSKEPVNVLFRPQKTLSALQWLCANNHLYDDINLSDVFTCDIGENDEASSTDLVEQEFGVIPKDYIPSTDIEPAINNSSAAKLRVVNTKPVNVKDTTDGEQKAFPWLFPFGINGISTDRPLQLTDTQYYQSRLYNKDPRWRHELPYLMSAVNQIEWTRLLSTVNLYMRTCKPCKDKDNNTGRNFEPMTASDINNFHRIPDILSQS